MDRVVECAGVVEGDLLCKGCGYDLRTLPREGRCPECGEAVAASVAYAAANPRALRGPRRVMVAAGMLGLWCVACALTPAVILLAQWWRPSLDVYVTAYFCTRVISRAVGALALGMSLALLWGAGLRAPPGDRLRVAKRWWAAAVVLAAVVDLVLGESRLWTGCIFRRFPE